MLEYCARVHSVPLVYRSPAYVLFRILVDLAVVTGGLIDPAVIALCVVAVLVVCGVPLCSVSHIPVRIHQGDDGLDLVATLVVAALGGALVSVLYVRSDQVPPVPPQWIFCVLAIGAIAWIEVSARHSGRMPWRRTPP